YFYFFCRGRQEGLCNQPYLNVPAVEQAVIRHYTTVVFADEFKVAIRSRLDEALAGDLGSTQAVRERLDAVDGLIG
ncbi:MAG: hypothetical protein ACRDN1_21260, partial [Trebonia sp.]